MFIVTRAGRSGRCSKPRQNAANHAGRLWTPLPEQDPRGWSGSVWRGALFAAALGTASGPAGAPTFDFEVVFQTGDPAPGVAGTSFFGFVPAPINDQGEAALVASVTGPGVTNETFRVLGRAGSGGAFAPLIRAGDPAPGIAGATVSGF
ncbi:MAG: hypothetical protein AAFN05_14465, partial [Pseudomonadota bacterium]